MRNTPWLRYGLGLLLSATGVSAALVACSDSDTGTVTPASDAGDDEADAGNPNGDTDAGEVIPPKLTVVNAASDLGPAANFPIQDSPESKVSAMRICFATAGAGSEFSITTAIGPQPDTKTSDLPPGIVIGTGGALPRYAIDLSTAALKPYLMNAKSLADKGVVPGGSQESLKCSDLLGASNAGVQLQAGVDYWEMPAFELGTFKRGESYILALTGCPSTTTIGATTAEKRAKCGEDFPDQENMPGNGNLKITVIQVDRTTSVAADKFGAQFIHASPAGAAVLKSGSLAAQPCITQTASDGGTDCLDIANNAPVELLKSSTLTQLPISAASLTAPATDATAAKLQLGQGQALASIALPLSLIQQLSFAGSPKADQAYRLGAGFVFVAVGDPTYIEGAAQDPAKVIAAFRKSDLRHFHYLGFPTDPTIVSYFDQK